MSRGLNKLMANLRGCDLKMGAFEISRMFGDGVYSKEMRQALQLFTTLPCVETGVVLISACPEAALVLGSSGGDFARTIPKEFRGPKFDGFDDWMSSFDKNISACESIQKFLLDGAMNGVISIGFHRMRDQQALVRRLEMIGIRKGVIGNRHQFLRHKITHSASAFRSVFDLICIHGIHGGREHFWNALGAELDPQLHLQSEIQYDLSAKSLQFSELLNALSDREPSEAS